MDKFENKSITDNSEIEYVRLLIIICPKCKNKKEIHEKYLKDINRVTCIECNENFKPYDNVGI